MICDFDSLPQNSKIWIYQSSRMLEDHELQTINTFLNENIKMWTSHGSALTGSFKILEDRFVILACDLSKNAPSGCSIDSSTKWFKDLSSILNVDLFDRSISYINDGIISSFPFLEGKKQVEAGVINPETEIFNNNLTQLSELQNSWKITAKDSHLKRHFAVKVV